MRKVRTAVRKQAPHFLLLSVFLSVRFVLFVVIFLFLFLSLFFLALSARIERNVRE
jgi:hypothetical protein